MYRLFITLVLIIIYFGITVIFELLFGFALAGDFIGLC